MVLVIEYNSSTHFVVVVAYYYYQFGYCVGNSHNKKSIFRVLEYSRLGYVLHILISTPVAEAVMTTVAIIETQYYGYLSLSVLEYSSTRVLEDNDVFPSQMPLCRISVELFVVVIIRLE